MPAIDESNIRTTLGEIERFEESMLWMDIQDELTSLAKKAMLEYDIVGEPHVDDYGFKIVPTTSETLIHLGDIKGRRKAVDYFLSMLEIFKLVLEERKNESTDGERTE